MKKSRLKDHLNFLKQHKDTIHREMNLNDIPSIYKYTTIKLDKPRVRRYFLITCLSFLIFFKTVCTKCTTEDNEVICHAECNLVGVNDWEITKAQFLFIHD